MTTWIPTLLASSALMLAVACGSGDDNISAEQIDLQSQEASRRLCENLKNEKSCEALDDCFWTGGVLLLSYPPQEIEEGCYWQGDTDGLDCVVSSDGVVTTTECGGTDDSGGADGPGTEGGSPSTPSTDDANAEPISSDEPSESSEVDHASSCETLSNRSSCEDLDACYWQEAATLMIYPPIEIPEGCFAKGSDDGGGCVVTSVDGVTTEVDCDGGDEDSGPGGAEGFAPSSP